MSAPKDFAGSSLPDVTNLPLTALAELDSSTLDGALARTLPPTAGAARCSGNAASGRLWEQHAGQPR
jgi:hypothetical protein